MKTKQSLSQNNLDPWIPPKNPPPLTIGEKLIFLLPILAIALPCIGILIIKYA